MRIRSSSRSQVVSSSFATSSHCATAGPRVTADFGCRSSSTWPRSLVSATSAAPHVRSGLAHVALPAGQQVSDGVDGPDAAGGDQNPKDRHASLPWLRGGDRGTVGVWGLGPQMTQRRRPGPRLPRTQLSHLCSPDRIRTGATALRHTPWTLLSPPSEVSFVPISTVPAVAGALELPQSQCTNPCTTPTRKGAGTRTSAPAATQPEAIPTGLVGRPSSSPASTRGSSGWPACPGGPDRAPAAGRPAPPRTRRPPRPRPPPGPARTPDCAVRSACPGGPDRAPAAGRPAPPRTRRPRRPHPPPHPARTPGCAGWSACSGGPDRAPAPCRPAAPRTRRPPRPHPPPDPASTPGCSGWPAWAGGDRKSTRLNSSHVKISYAVFCLKKTKKKYYLLFLKKQNIGNTLQSE